MVLPSPRNTSISCRTIIRLPGRRILWHLSVVPVPLWSCRHPWMWSRLVSRTAILRTLSLASALSRTWWKTRGPPVSSRVLHLSCSWPGPSLFSASGWLRRWSPRLARSYKREEHGMILIAGFKHLAFSFSFSFFFLWLISFPLFVRLLVPW